MKPHEEARQSQATLQQAIDANILQNQWDQRAQPETACRTHFEEEFSLSWSRKKVEAENACCEQMKGWVVTSDFKEQEFEETEGDTQVFFNNSFVIAG